MPVMTQTQDCAPVALFVFNRPEHTRRTVESLLENNGSAQTSLIIFSDGPRSEKDVSLVDSVRDYIRTIKGFRDVRVVEQPENRGLAESVIEGVTEVVEQYGRVIVLEDDMETSPFFLDYMRAMEKYRDDDNVYCIHGYAFPADMSDVSTETFFLGGAECWGWATWKRAWDHFCPDAAQLLDLLRSQKIQKAFDYDGNYPYTRMLERQSRGRIDSWAIRWRASAFVRQGLTLWPRVSLVRNFGMDGSGVHCDSTSYFDVALADKPVVLADIPVQINSAAFHAYGSYLKQREGGFLQRAGRFIRKRMNNVLSD
jgi:hypothetical protein